MKTVGKHQFIEVGFKVSGASAHSKRRKMEKTIAQKDDNMLS